MRRWVKDGFQVFLSRITAKKINMLLMWNLKIEYKKFVMHKKRFFFCDNKSEILFFFDTWQQKYITMTQYSKQCPKQKYTFVSKQKVWCCTKSNLCRQRQVHVSLLNYVGSVGSWVAWVRGLKICVGHMGCVGLWVHEIVLLKSHY